MSQKYCSKSDKQIFVYTFYVLKSNTNGTCFKNVINCQFLKQINLKCYNCLFLKPFL